METAKERDQLKAELAELRELFRTTSIRNYELKRRLAMSDPEDYGAALEKVQRLEERNRVLEEIISKAEQHELEELIDLRERIQKAREILLDSTYPLDDKICDRVNVALDALEGK